ncbi:peptidoglycan D,D-transpeptidase FtsI family protein [Crenothrix polyspora]|uniref:Peptidoglycan D,D-transpeptidase FtsI n=1 Tax=Crenothrix polyspora TaxID=360316 RepID=A0A1R4H7X3_9GAMM|nr:penicillin-binding transpeptidase domain-containing protein [Crenothrix polyspora]SJM92343.1 transpeptidase involved in septal peptidoglycan synthesis (penicillin-binding protein 3) [Crenothrix polyspora]
MVDLRNRSNLKERKPAGDFSSRRRFVLVFMMSCMIILVARAVDLQVISKKYLKDQGDMRHVDEVSVSAYRGMITDRTGAPLAISSPVQTVSVSPKQLNAIDKNQLKALEKKLRKSQQGHALTGVQKAEVLAVYEKDKVLKVKQMLKILGLPASEANKLLNKTSKFAYLAQRINPIIADQVKALELPGVNVEQGFKRFYPTGEVSGHLIGFTDVNDVGQEGLERSYENFLKGLSGSKRVIRDGQRQVIADIENIKEPVAGKTLELSIDQRIQYLAYRELQTAVETHKAKSGSIVVLDAKSGEVLAAANQPSFNPNTKTNLKENLYRNRAITNIFEPGSTVKPFVVAAAMDGGYIRPNELFETHGIFPIGTHMVRDVHNYGTLDATGVLKKSSNVGVAKMALKMPPEYFWDTYHKLGFGVSPGSGFPSEASGSLLDHRRWRDFDRATMSFGYGLSVSALQLARSYTALADDGILHSISLLKRDEDIDSKRVFTAKTAKKVRAMLETVISKDGTAYEARVDGYRVAGKTGTVKKAGSGGYSEKTYFAVFAGMAPASHPRLIIVVMIDEPSAGDYYGGLVSAPVFSKVMAGALRIMEVAPDEEHTMPILLTKKGVIRPHAAE